MGITRTEKEIEDTLNESCVRAGEMTHFKGMTYEQGVNDTLEWLTNPDSESPMED